MIKEPCYLDSADIDLITETDHMNNYCLCSKCTCGLHKCPKLTVKKYPKSIFKSYYKLNYKFHDQKIRNQARSVSPTKLTQYQLESETTSGHYYKPQLNEYSMKTESPKVLENKPKYRMASSSTYKKDFSNWGTVKNETFLPKQTFSTRSVKFNANSTYLSHFKSFNGKAAEMVRPCANSNILGEVPDAVIPKSTMHDSYLTWKSKKIHTVAKNNVINNLPSLPGQWQTVNNNCYDVKTINKGIIRVRKTDYLL